MKKVSTFVKWAAVILIALVPHLALCQINVYMISGMDGELEMENGSTTNFWGYGYQSQDLEIQLPAPLLHLQLNDDITFNMLNVSPESHTIHLHGLDVDQANDGVPQTSFQVTPNESGAYSFTPTFPGTYLYHCHVTTTLHLTMGMYGMIVIDGPDNTIFEGGPGFNNEYEYLFSDLEVEVNDLPSAAYPFHEIQPDYFMVNGLQGDLIENDPEQHIQAHIGDSVVLRLGSMAYSLIEVSFPAGSNPVTYMSDGRVLPQQLEADMLEIYPGERFTTILYPDESFSGSLDVEYFSMLNQESLHVNSVPVENLGVHVGEHEETIDLLRVSPCPSKGIIQVESESSTVVNVFSAQGKWVARFPLNVGLNTVQLPNLEPGYYVFRSDAGYSIGHVIR